MVTIARRARLKAVQAIFQHRSLSTDQDTLISQFSANSNPASYKHDLFTSIILRYFDKKDTIAFSLKEVLIDVDAHNGDSSSAILHACILAYASESVLHIGLINEYLEIFKMFDDSSKSKVLNFVLDRLYNYSNVT